MEISNTDILIVAVVSFAGLYIIQYFIPVGLWYTAKASGVRISILDLIFIRFRKIPPSLIVYALIASAKGGFSFDKDELQAHHLAGGNIENLTKGMIYAKANGIKLSFREASKLDLARKDIIKEIQIKLDRKTKHNPG